MIPSEYGSSAPTSAKSSARQVRDDEPAALVDLRVVERAREQLQLRELHRLVDLRKTPWTSAPASTSSAASRSAFGVVFAYWKRPVSVTSATYSASAISGVSGDVERAEQVADDLGGRRGVGDDQVDGPEAGVVVMVVDVDARAAPARASRVGAEPAPLAQSSASSTRSAGIVGSVAAQLAERQEAVLAGSGRRRRGA